MSKSIPFHYFIAMQTIALMGTGVNRPSSGERATATGYERTKNTAKSFQHPDEIFISSSSIYKELSHAAIIMVVQIQQDLKMNNPLWECPGVKINSRTRKTIAELKKKEILTAISGTNLFLVNPAKIRKGRPLAIYGALYHYAEKQYKLNRNWRPTTKDIKRLIAPDKFHAPPILLTQDLPDTTQSEE